MRPVEQRPKTIQIFLPGGEPRGIRMAELTTRVVQTILVPRNRLPAAAQRSEIASVGVYFLFGESEEQAKPCVYIGEAEDCFHRLGQHNRSKDFWSTAIVAVSKTDAFTKAHAKYLEWYCLGEAQEAGRFQIENSTMPNKPYAPEPMLADLMDSFETLSVLLSTLGFPLFESVRRPTTSGTDDPSGNDSEDDLFGCTRRGANAQGRLLDDGFVVYEGSTVCTTVAASAGTYIAAFRENLLASGVLAKEGDVIVFKADYLFNSPSAASSAVLGRKSNGWIQWKRKDGKTLDELKRKR